ncbi:MAG: PilZ domain-containing protein [Phycisphaerales bacterium]
MPAFRSRTDRWKDVLDQIALRGGAIEIAVAPPDGGDTPDRSGPAEPADVVWRVRLLEISADALVVEPPAALGRTIQLPEGTQLIGALTVGQNRWMFRTHCTNYANARGGPSGQTLGLRLALPTDVERCPRRQLNRVSSAEIHLPAVECWLLDDPASTIAAETANRASIMARLGGRGEPHGPASWGESPLDTLCLPKTGPSLKGQMQNLSGGGMGLILGPDDCATAQRARFLWLKIDLRPDIPEPLALTARVAHTRLDSNRNAVVGLAFDFRHHPAHQRFATDLLAEYVQRLAARQGLRKAA